MPMSLPFPRSQQRFSNNMLSPILVSLSIAPRPLVCPGPLGHVFVFLLGCLAMRLPPTSLASYSRLILSPLMARCNSRPNFVHDPISTSEDSSPLHPTQVVIPLTPIALPISCEDCWTSSAPLRDVLAHSIHLALALDRSPAPVRGAAVEPHGHSLERAVRIFCPAPQYLPRPTPHQHMYHWHHIPRLAQVVHGGRYNCAPPSPCLISHNSQRSPPVLLAKPEERLAAERRYSCPSLRLLYPSPRSCLPHLSTPLAPQPPASFHAFCPTPRPGSTLHPCLKAPKAPAPLPP